MVLCLTHLSTHLQVGHCVYGTDAPSHHTAATSLMIGCTDLKQFSVQCIPGLVVRFILRKHHSYELHSPLLQSSADTPSFAELCSWTVLSVFTLQVHCNRSIQTAFCLLLSSYSILF